MKSFLEEETSSGFPSLLHSLLFVVQRSELHRRLGKVAELAQGSAVVRCTNRSHLFPQAQSLSVGSFQEALPAYVLVISTQLLARDTSFKVLQKALPLEVSSSVTSATVLFSLVLASQNSMKSGRNCHVYQ